MPKFTLLQYCLAPLWLVFLFDQLSWYLELWSQLLPWLVMALLTKSSPSHLGCYFFPYCCLVDQIPDTRTCKGERVYLARSLKVQSILAKEAPLL